MKTQRKDWLMSLLISLIPMIFGDCTAWKHRITRRLGLPYGPFNGPLLSLDQMLLIPGITEQLLYGYMRGRRGTEENGIGSSFQPDGSQQRFFV